MDNLRYQQTLTDFLFDHDVYVDEEFIFTEGAPKP